MHHAEMFGADYKLLDALYDAGVIPTYSFPKNVVSTYVVGDNGKIIYRIERGLNIAISECAPGRAIVVDKKTYQIGGIYRPANPWSSTPARRFFDDPHYFKELSTCEHCGWFGLREESRRRCPFCGSEELSHDKKMLVPWGFAPKNAAPIVEAQLDEEYSTAQPPEYSTLPEHDEIAPIASCKHIRMASRDNQRIIMLNKGPSNSGFVVCRDCGAAMPDTSDKPLKDVGRPYRSKYGCKHAEAVVVNLGFDFVTDMLILEFALDDRRIDTRRDNENLWLDRAAQSVAEAFRLVACKELDVDYRELVTGYRIRRTNAAQKTFVDVYIYDNLSGGAGYSVRIASEIENLFEQMKKMLANCDCETACNNCLKHYGNQYVHGRLDRHYGLQLLEWGMSGRLADEISADDQRRYLASIEYLLSEIGCDAKKLAVYPAMRTEPKGSDKIYIPDSYFKYALPYVSDKIKVAP